MKLGEIYKLAVEKGIKEDPRGENAVLSELKKRKEKYEKLSKEEKQDFDKEKLANPYADTRILNGDGDRQVKTVMVGVDMEASEVVAAQLFSAHGKKVDLVFAHHPQGSAYASFYEVMYMQAEIISKYGVAINVAEGMLKERIREVGRRVMPANHQKAVDIAKLFNMPMICVHTPADNCVTSYLQAIMDKKKPGTVKEVVDILKEVPEYKEGAKQNNGPEILVGANDNSAGKVFIDMTGGTEGSVKIFDKLSNTNVGTIVCMHMSAEHCKEAEKNHISVISAGHISSDNVGLNIILDTLCKKESLEIIAVSGFRRFSRIKK